MEDEEAEDEAEDESMAVDGLSVDPSDWDFRICLKKKAWRQKEAEMRAALKKPKTSDMFEGV